MRRNSVINIYLIARNTKRCAYLDSLYFECFVLSFDLHTYLSSHYFITIYLSNIILHWPIYGKNRHATIFNFEDTNIIDREANKCPLAAYSEREIGIWNENET